MSENTKKKSETRYRPNGVKSFERVVEKDGTWIELSFNETRKVVRYEDSTGYWDEKTYYIDGSVAALINCNNYMERWTYRKDGTVLRHTNKKLRN